MNHTPHRNPGRKQLLLFEIKTISERDPRLCRAKAREGKERLRGR